MELGWNSEGSWKKDLGNKLLTLSKHVLTGNIVVQNSAYYFGSLLIFFSCDRRLNNIPEQGVKNY